MKKQLFGNGQMVYGLKIGVPPSTPAKLYGKSATLELRSKTNPNRFTEANWEESKANARFTTGVYFDT